MSELRRHFRADEGGMATKNYQPSPGKVACHRCLKVFDSCDRRRNRRCPKCSAIKCDASPVHQVLSNSKHTKTREQKC